MLLQGNYFEALDACCCTTIFTRQCFVTRVPSESPKTFHEAASSVLQAVLLYAGKLVRNFLSSLALLLLRKLKKKHVIKPALMNPGGKACWKGNAG